MMGFLRDGIEINWLSLSLGLIFSSLTLFPCLSAISLIIFVFPLFIFLSLLVLHLPIFLMKRGGLAKFWLPTFSLFGQHWKRGNLEYFCFCQISNVLLWYSVLFHFPEDGLTELNWIFVFSVWTKQNWPRTICYKKNCWWNLNRNEQIFLQGSSSRILSLLRIN